MFTSKIERLWRDMRANMPHYGTCDYHFIHYIVEFLFKKKILFWCRYGSFFYNYESYNTNIIMAKCRSCSKNCGGSWCSIMVFVLFQFCSLQIFLLLNLMFPLDLQILKFSYYWLFFSS